ncbi:MAG TPA: hypothetical protein VNZ52_16890 [Candidatus Thermoplasmatota archaeon]|nr:hypothetical protein [Candidatus Thermoplasmatota archaeon]
MATSPRSDAVILRRETKARLAAAKEEATFEEAVAALLEEVPPDRLAALLRARRQRPPPPRPTPPSMPRPGMAAGPDRSPEKQVLMARLAAERRRQWEAQGRLERLGPRRTRLNLQPEAPPAGGSVIRVVRRPGGRGPA